MKFLCLKSFYGFSLYFNLNANILHIPTDLTFFHFCIPPQPHVNSFSVSLVYPHWPSISLKYGRQVHPYFRTFVYAFPLLKIVYHPAFRISAPFHMLCLSAHTPWPMRFPPTRLSK